MDIVFPFEIVLVLFVVLVVAVLLTGVKIVPQSSNYIIERFGKYRARLEPGLNIIVPIIDRVAHRVDILERQLPRYPASVITKDNVIAEIDTSTFYRVLEPQNTVYRIKDIDKAIQNTVTAAIRSNIGTSDLDEIQSNREKLNESLLQATSDTASEWGIRITRCEIIDVNVDEETRKAMQQQVIAERRRRAAVTEAEGEKTAAQLKADGELYVAQKQAEARRVEADAEAYATQEIAQAINNDGQAAAEYEIRKSQIGAMRALGEGENSRLVVLPAEAAQSFGGAAGMMEMFNFAGRGSSGGRPSGDADKDTGPWA